MYQISLNSMHVSQQYNTYTATICINEHTHTHTHIHIHISTYIHTHFHRYTRANIRTYITHYIKILRNYDFLPTLYTNGNYQSPLVCNVCMFVCPPTNSKRTDTERELINGQYNFRAFIC